MIPIELIMAATLYDELAPIQGQMSYNYRDIPELREFFLENVQKTGKRLGSGAFGIVEELTAGGTNYAGKTLHSTLLDAHNEGIDRVIQRFISECKLMSTVRHPNIVQFMGLCLFHNSIHPSLVMEKLDVNLEYVLGTYNNLPLPLTLRVLMDITKGLIYLHSKSPPIIHRDLTARNVLINIASMNAKIADLGNALMVDPTKFSNTLSQAPGTLPYMPPEAILCKPSYDSSLDIFSFGHLGLFAVTQIHPGNLLPPTYVDPSNEKLTARSEVERRKEYTSVLVAKFTKDHIITGIIFQCLHNLPDKRPTASEILKKLEKAYKIEEDPYVEINLVDLISKTDEREVKLVQSTSFTKVQESIPLEYQIEAIKNKEEFRKLDIYRFHGKMKRRQDWRTHDFQIKNGFLKYFKSDAMDTPHDELNLSLVACVSACPSHDNTSMFHFEIHFSGNKGSPWLLRARTEDDRTCWMEAIQPGSSTVVRSPTADAYEILSPLAEGGTYSYTANVPHKPQPPSVAIYEEPDVSTKTPMVQVKSPPPAPVVNEYDEPIPVSARAPSMIQKQIMDSPTQSQPQTEALQSHKEDSDNKDDYNDSYYVPEKLEQDAPPPAPVEYDEPIPVSTRAPSMIQKQITDWTLSPTQLELQTEVLQSHNEDSDDDDDDIYCDIPEELEQEGSYIEIVQADHPAPRRSATIPKELASIAEISLENLADLDQKETQLWMLLHMQKMVQKMEQVYGSTQPLSPKADKQPIIKSKPPPKPVNLCSKTKAPSPPSSPPPEEIEEIYDEDIGPIELEASREDLYINLDTLSEAPPPPIPPRTYQRADDEVDSYRNRSRTRSEIPPQNTRQVPSSSKPAPSHGRWYDAQPQQTRTLPPNRRSTAMALIQDTQAPQHHSKSAVQQQTLDTIPVVQQKRETSKEEMISTLKASNRAISSDIASHLVIDDDGTYYAVGKRPEWAKAKTQTFGLEPSLADLHQKALFLPRLSLQNLEEIGQGQYGKVFKGNYKRSEGPGYPVAVKTIKQYESEKEKDGFLKEMNIMSKLMHPNIVRLFGLVQQEEPWIVLEYLPHGDLKIFLTKNKRSTEKLIKYMLDVATGMHYISEKGLVHRDLAARNIMVSQDEICKVGDFGLLRELPKDDTIYVAKTKLAFPIRWMAPESLIRREFSPASDVWSFGVVMWEMYNPARKPYKGMNNTQVAVNVNEGLRLQIPEAYPAIVEKIMKACWQHSPSKRPSFLLIASLLTNVYFGSE